MFKLLSNIGCLTVIVFAIIIFNAVKNAPEHVATPSANKKESAAQMPDAMIIEMQFRQGDRSHLRRTYGPKANIGKASTPRVGNHPDGWAFVHQFTGTDELGHAVESMSGLLYKTNASPSWTYYSAEALPDLLKEVTVNGKPLPL